MGVIMRCIGMMGMKRKLITLLICIMVLSGIRPVNTYAWEHREYTEKQIEEAMESGYRTDSRAWVGRSGGAFLYEVHRYLQQQTLPVVDAYNLDTYKAFYKRVVDLSLDYLEWNDYSAFDEDAYIQLGKDEKGYPTRNFIKLVNEQQANLLVLVQVLSMYHQDSFLSNKNRHTTFKISIKYGDYPDGQMHKYLYVFPYTQDADSPFYCLLENDSIIDKKGWYSDIYRYAQTRDPQYLFSETLFPDITDQDQIDAENNRIMTYEQFIDYKKEVKRQDAENMRMNAQRMEDFKAGKYKAVCINYEGTNHRKRQLTFNWYSDESLNTNWKNQLLANYAEGEEQKFSDALAEIPEGGSIEFQEVKTRVEGEPLLKKVLMRIN